MFFYVPLNFRFITEHSNYDINVILNGKYFAF